MKPDIRVNREVDLKPSLYSKYDKDSLPYSDGNVNIDLTKRTEYNSSVLKKYAYSAYDYIEFNVNLSDWIITYLNSSLEPANGLADLANKIDVVKYRAPIIAAVTRAKVMISIMRRSGFPIEIIDVKFDNKFTNIDAMTISKSKLNRKTISITLDTMLTRYLINPDQFLLHVFKERGIDYCETVLQQKYAIGKSAITDYFIRQASCVYALSLVKKNLKNITRLRTYMFTPKSREIFEKDNALLKFKTPELQKQLLFNIMLGIAVVSGAVIGFSGLGLAKSAAALTGVALGTGAAAYAGSKWIDKKWEDIRKDVINILYESDSDQLNRVLKLMLATYSRYYKSERVDKKLIDIIVCDSIVKKHMFSDSNVKFMMGDD